MKSINNVDSSISVVVVVCNGLVEIKDSGGVVVVKSMKKFSIILDENISDGEVEFVKIFSWFVVGLGEVSSKELENVDRESEVVTSIVVNTELTLVIAKIK